MRVWLTILWGGLFTASAIAQQAQLSGTVLSSEDQKPVSGALVLLQPGFAEAETDKAGTFLIKDLEPGTYTLTVHKEGTEVNRQEVSLKQGPNTVQVALKSLEIELEEVEVLGASQVAGMGMERLSSVDGMAIYAGKKNEVVIPDQLPANKATNNPRQVYAKVPGLNIWESDGVGVQLGIGARGLSPNRTSNFNTRQNGYDISADALGYPESYYTPPIEAIERIEFVRGAASLQYGTQFGGLINFVLKQPPSKESFHVTTRQTVGSFGLFNSFNSVSLSRGKWGLYSFYQFKRSDGWRPNSSINQHTGHVHISRELTKRLQLSGEATMMYYTSQQPGGLTDAQFDEDPRQSNRERNWFRVSWNIFNLNLDYRISNKTRLNVRNFALVARRQSLGNLERINRADFGDNRTLIDGKFRNVGNETRLLHTYSLFGNPQNFLAGVRLYHGYSEAQQGDASDGSGADFSYLNPDDLEGSDYSFPSKNYSVFVENVFRVTPNWSITPGARFEYIETHADGWYKQVVRNMAGEVIVSRQINEDRALYRNFILLGIGTAYQLGKGLEVYANFSENYRAVTFSDIRIDNPNIRVNPNITDETGYNVDIGVRGGYENILYFDASVFYLAYDNRIGFVTQEDLVTFQEIRYRTNIGDSRAQGIEAFVEWDIWRTLKGKGAKTGLSWFVNTAYTQAEYVRSDDELAEGNEVELVPPVTFRTGLTFKNGAFRAGYQFSYTAEQYTDAYNTEDVVPTAIAGPVPAYWVSDVSVSYSYRKWVFETGCNNLFDHLYFTRRATGYPGPGILPSDGRNVYLTVGLSF